MHIVNPYIPFTAPIVDGLRPGRHVDIHGKSTQGPKQSFEINLYSGNQIALHVNPRFNQNRLVLNSQINGSWGAELSDHNHIHMHQPFHMQIKVHPAHFDVLVNGHSVRFPHRLQPETITSITINGDVVIDKIHFEGFPHHQHHHGPQGAAIGAGAAMMPAGGQMNYMMPPMPFRCPLVGGFMPPRRATIVGQANGDFQINLMCGGDYHFHFNPRLGAQTVVRNSTKHGGNNWQHEEKSQPYFPFALGQSFNVVIETTGAAFNVKVNGQPFVTFNVRDNAQAIDALTVQGAVQLQLVNVQL